MKPAEEGDDEVLERHREAGAGEAEHGGRLARHSEHDEEREEQGEDVHREAGHRSQRLHPDLLSRNAAEEPVRHLAPREAEREQAEEPEQAPEELAQRGAGVALDRRHPRAVGLAQLLQVLQPAAHRREPALGGGRAGERLHRLLLRALALGLGAGGEARRGDLGRLARGHLALPPRGEVDAARGEALRPVGDVAARLGELREHAAVPGPGLDALEEAARRAGRGRGGDRRPRLLLGGVVHLAQEPDAHLRIAAGPLKGVARRQKLVLVELQLRARDLELVLHGLPAALRLRGEPSLQLAHPRLRRVHHRLRPSPGVRLRAQLRRLVRGALGGVAHRHHEGEVDGVVGEPLGLARQLLLLRGGGERGEVARSEQRPHVHQPPPAAGRCAGAGRRSSALGGGALSPRWRRPGLGGAGRSRARPLLPRRALAREDEASARRQEQQDEDDQGHSPRRVHGGTRP
jgi:hypothetical protein